MIELDRLSAVVAEDAAIRRRQILQPVGGKGDKIFPPTYPAERNNPPRHVYEKRKIDGRDVWCVLVDSVASQANRMEEALQAAIAEDVPIPHLYVDFAGKGIAGVERITSLEAPHRVYDAILRDSLLDGLPFMSSPIGTRLAAAKPPDAAALLEVAPTALLFGSWHSTGQGGGLGAKFARCLVSEIVAVDVPVEEIVNDRTGAVEPRTLGQRVGSRIDPLGILSEIKIYQAKSDPNDWTPFEEDAARKGNDPILFIRKKGQKAGRPAVINHGNIAPSVQPLGVTCDRLDHTFVLSCAGLRRLAFGGGARDAAGRTLLAALGLLAVTEQDARGYALRSRCDLVCDRAAPFEIVRADGSTEPIAVTREAARSLYREAFAKATEAGLGLCERPIRLEPQEKLVAIVKKSQELALAGKGGEAEAEED
jgi:CRISPR-associated protein Csb1